MAVSRLRLLREALEAKSLEALRQTGDANGDGRYDLVVIDEVAIYMWLRGDGGPMRRRRPSARRGPLP